MKVRYRPMRARDVAECVRLIATHPVRARYGPTISHLGEAWLRLLARDGVCTTAVVEAEVGSRIKIAAVGLDVFVGETFLREVKTAPSFWIGPELTRRSKTGDSPVLLEKEIAEANSRGGLNVVVWDTAIRAEHQQDVEVGNALLGAFLEFHRGYLLKEVIGQAENVKHLEVMCETGGEVWNFAKRRYERLGDKAARLFPKPHVVGMTRATALGEPGAWGKWMTALFAYRQPRLELSRSEQRLLTAALDGGTDEELSTKLSVSLNTIKKTWRSIYDRTAAAVPELVPGDALGSKASSKRGRTKKQRLLAYLREHHEELRPVSRKLL